MGYACEGKAYLATVSPEATVDSKHAGATGAKENSEKVICSFAPGG
jgi:hypothetical protein